MDRLSDPYTAGALHTANAQPKETWSAWHEQKGTSFLYINN